MNVFWASLIGLGLIMGAITICIVIGGAEKE